MSQRKVKKIFVKLDCILKIFCLLILILITAKNVVQGPINTWMRNSTKFRENEMLIQGKVIILFKSKKILGTVDYNIFRQQRPNSVLLSEENLIMKVNAMLQFCSMYQYT